MGFGLLMAGLVGLAVGVRLILSGVAQDKVQENSRIAELEYTHLRNLQTTLHGIVKRYDDLITQNKADIENLIEIIKNDETIKILKNQSDNEKHLVKSGIIKSEIDNLFFHLENRVELYATPDLDKESIDMLDSMSIIFDDAKSILSRIDDLINKEIYGDTK